MKKNYQEIAEEINSLYDQIIESSEIDTDRIEELKEDLTNGGMLPLEEVASDYKRSDTEVEIPATDEEDYAGTYNQEPREGIVVIVTGAPVTDETKVATEDNPRYNGATIEEMLNAHVPTMETDIKAYERHLRGYNR